MRALALHLPLMLVMLGAVVWVFVIAAAKPHWFRQTASRRALWCTVEGVICALFWVLLKPLVEQMLGFTGFLDASVAGLAWAGMSFYGKSRFRTDLYHEEKQRLRQIFRR